ncbi:MAG: rod shape-determining protein MreC [Actinobacteria bacterium ATB1]|nr:rod shape-determining protein MreC [Actinobacteria bacterium ATB1]
MVIFRRRPVLRRRILLILLVSVAVVLITMEFNSGGEPSSLRKALLTVVEPVESAVGTVTRPIGRFISGLIHSGDLKAENDLLTKRVEELEKEQADAARLERENDELRELTKLQNQDDFAYLTTRVSGVRVSNTDWSIEIDSGTENGISDGNPVLAGQGLVGRVTDATSNRSKVMLLSDPQFSVTVRDERSGVTGVVTGRAEDPPRLELVEASADVQEGDLLTTSGFEGSSFPAGIPVGSVVAVRTDDSGLTLRIEVEPFADATRREYVSVLLWTPSA